MIVSGNALHETFYDISYPKIELITKYEICHL